MFSFKAACSATGTVIDPCTELTLKLKCKGIVQADGQTEINTPTDLERARAHMEKLE